MLQRPVAIHDVGVAAVAAATDASACGDAAGAPTDGVADAAADGGRGA